MHPALFVSLSVSLLFLCCLVLLMSAKVPSLRCFSGGRYKKSFQCFHYYSPKVCGFLYVLDLLEGKSILVSKHLSKDIITVGLFRNCYIAEMYVWSKTVLSLVLMIIPNRSDTKCMNISHSGVMNTHFGSCTSHFFGHDEQLVNKQKANRKVCIKKEKNNNSNIINPVLPYLVLNMNQSPYCSSLVWVLSLTPLSHTRLSW